jgi:small subunit ribosomal protein S18
VIMSSKKDKTFDFKDVEELKNYLTPLGKLLPASRTGLSGREQRRLKRAIKMARQLSLISYGVQS